MVSRLWETYAFLTLRKFIRIFSQWLSLSPCLLQFLCFFDAFLCTQHILSEQEDGYNEWVSGQGCKTEIIIEQKAYGTGSSQAVPHPSTIPARRCLTSVIRRERVCSSWYGRRQRIYVFISFYNERASDSIHCGICLYGYWWCGEIEQKAQRSRSCIKITRQLIQIPIFQSTLPNSRVDIDFAFL